MITIKTNLLASMIIIYGRNNIFNKNKRIKIKIVMLHRNHKREKNSWLVHQANIEDDFVSCECDRRYNKIQDFKKKKTVARICMKLTVSLILQFYNRVCSHQRPKYDWIHGITLDGGDAVHNRFGRWRIVKCLLLYFYRSCTENKNSSQVVAAASKASQIIWNTSRCFCQYHCWIHPYKHTRAQDIRFIYVLL